MSPTGTTRCRGNTLSRCPTSEPRAPRRRAAPRGARRRRRGPRARRPRPVRRRPRAAPRGSLAPARRGAGGPPRASASASACCPLCLLWPPSRCSDPKNPLCGAKIYNWTTMMVVIRHEVRGGGGRKRWRAGAAWHARSRGSAVRRRQQGRARLARREQPALLWTSAPAYRRPLARGAARSARGAALLRAHSPQIYFSHPTQWLQVGHWLDLHHTDSEACSDDVMAGDGVADTPSHTSVVSPRAWGARARARKPATPLLMQPSFRRPRGHSQPHHVCIYVAHHSAPFELHPPPYKN